MTLKRSVLLLFVALAAILLLGSCSDAGDDPAETSGEHVCAFTETRTLTSPTCEQGGLLEKLCSCGARVEEQLPPAGHAEGEEIVMIEPTLRESGVARSYCATCGAMTKESTVPRITFDRLPAIVDKTEDKLRPYYGLGINKRLEGKPVVVLLYMDDQESKWTKEEIDAFTKNEVCVALDYLEERAKEWGVELDFVVESLSTPDCDFRLRYFGVVNRDLYEGGATTDILDQAAACIGCDDEWGLYSYYKMLYPDEEILFVPLFNKSGRSYTTRTTGTGNCKSAEDCTIFADDLDGSPETRVDGSRAIQLVRRILCLYGAETFSGMRQLMAQTVYPREVMLFMEGDVHEYEIDEFTAFVIGWSEVTPVVFESDWWWA